MPPKLPGAPTSKNYDADVHSLKGKVSDVINALPEYDQFKSFVVDILNGEKYTDRITALTRQKIKIQQATNAIEELYDDLNSTYERLIDIYRDEPAESRLKKQMDKLEDEEKVTSLIRTLKSIRVLLKNIKHEIGEHIELINTLHGPSNTQDRPENTTVRPDDNLSYAKVEALRVPKFNGECYAEFIASFDDLIHNNPKYSKNAKAQYFKSAIIGKAAKCISGIPATGENYRHMYEKIKARYSRVSLNQHSIMRRLENLKPATYDSKSLESKLDEIEEILNLMNAADIGIEDDTNPTWQRQILRKFPIELAGKIVTENHGNMNFTVRDLLNSIEEETFGIAFKEDAGFSPESAGDTKGASNYQVREGANVYAEREINHNNNVRNNTQYKYNGNPSCTLCDNPNHAATSCNLPIEEKIRAVKRRKLCWKCFKTNHTSFDCRSSNCLCGKPHHETICRREGVTNSWNANNRNAIASSNFNNRDNVFNHQVPQNHNYTPQYGYKNGTNGQNNFYPINENRITTGNPSSNDLNRNVDRRAYIPANRVEFRSHPAITDGDPMMESNDNFRSNEIEDDSLQISHTSVETKQWANEAATLMTCETKIYNNISKGYVDVVIFFDTGSQQTLINTDFAKSLGLEGEQRVISVSGVNGITEKFSTTKLDLSLLDQFGNEVNIAAVTKSFITKGFRSANLDSNDVNFIRGRKIKIANSKISGELIRPHILVGADVYTRLVLNEPAIILPSNLQMVNTVFGSCIFGKKGYIPPRNFNEYSEMVVHSAQIEPIEDNEKTANQMLKEMFELESLGIRHSGTPAIENTVKYYEKYKGSISFENNKVTAPFPLKEDISKLNSNWKMANVRLSSLVNMFSNNAQMKDCYLKKMKEYEEKGIIEEVTTINDFPNKIGVYYIPHHGVWNPIKKDKPLRIVFDASSKQKGHISLNEAIHTGETFVNKIANIILGARRTKYIILSDLESAFTMIHLPNEYQDLCRFLWLRDPSKPTSKDNLLEFRFKRLPFGVNASPSILNMSIVSFLESKNDELSAEILKLLYVDNIILGADIESEMITKIERSRDIFKEISFNLREFVTNNPKINAEIAEKDKGKTGQTKLLGVHYNTDEDTYKVKIDVRGETNLTRKTVVKQLHSIYDPIGLLAPAVISLRFIMRDVFELTNHWNENLRPELATEWKTLIEQYNKGEVTIPRHLGDEHRKCTNQILWVFTDASKQAFAACSYLQDRETKHVSCLLSGKTKLTPKVKVPLEDTIPKFELSSILLGIEVAKNVIESLELNGCKIYLVNDSTSALTWVTLSKRLRRSCELIKDKIISATESLKGYNDIETEFFHCATHLNVADIGTRGVSPHDLQQSEWVNGPKWIHQASEKLPITPYTMQRGEIATIEEAELPLQSNQAIVVETKQSLFNLNHVESTFRAKWVMAKVLNMLKRKVRAIRNKHSNQGEMGILWSQLSGKHFTVTTADLEIAERVILINEQRNVDIAELKSKYRQKELFEDEYGLKRSKSRLQNAEIDYDTKNPLFLPRTSEYLRLLLSEYHTQYAHCGKDYLIMILKQRFWTPRPTKLINEIIRKCLPCKISSSLPFRAPAMPSLPIDRVKTDRAFKFTGVDYLGPFQTNEHEKVYVSLFTCLVVRAVHLEVVTEASGSEFLKAFIRFTSRRGTPKIMRSDNGTNFVLAAKVIDSVYEINEKGESAMNYSKKHGISWIFNPPKAPFMGGVWERLVRTVKSAFYKSIGRRTLSLSDFQTIMVKIEGIVNSRPLTAVNNEGVIRPIRPCDLICPGADLTTPAFNDNFDDEDYDPEGLTNVNEVKERLKEIELRVDNFWCRFKKEYLVTLRDQQKLILRQGKCSRLKSPVLNELVIIEEDLIPKEKWSMGKIVKLIKSKDGEIRSAVVDCNNGKLVHRPIIYLYPLEIYDNSESKEDESVIDNTFGEINIQETELRKIERPTRDSKRQALERISKITNSRDPDEESLSGALQLN